MYHYDCITQGDSAAAQAIAKSIAEKMDLLERELRLGLTSRVAEDFKDPMGALNALTEACMAPLGGCGLLIGGGGGGGGGGCA